MIQCAHCGLALPDDHLDGMRDHLDRVHDIETTTNTRDLDAHITDG